MMKRLYTTFLLLALEEGLTCGFVAFASNAALVATQSLLLRDELSSSSSSSSSSPPPSPSPLSKQRAFTLKATVPEEQTQEAGAAMEKSRQQIPDMKAYATGYTTVVEEVPFRRLGSKTTTTPSLQGTIPADLKGSYFRAGPAMFSAGSILPPKTSIVQPKNPPVPDGQDPARMVRHPFEGDGAVLAITFGCNDDKDSDSDNNNNNNINNNNSAAVANSNAPQAIMRYRYVRTNALVIERKKGQKCYNGMESTREMGSDCALGLGNDWQLPLYRHHFLPGLNKNRKNTSNSRVIYWGKRLFTLWEGGLPYKLDALALSTEGRSQLGGAILRDEDPFGSKMVIDSMQNRALFYGLEPSAKQSQLTLYEFGPDFRLVNDNGGGGRKTVSLRGFAVLNDFGATKNYAVFVQPAIMTTTNTNNIMMPFLFQKNEPGKVTSLDPRAPAMLHLIPRVGSSLLPASPLRSFAIPMDDFTDANLQIVNAYEEENNGDGDGPVVVILDAIRTRGAPPGKTLPTWPWVDTLEKYQAAAGTKSLWRYTANLQTGKVTKECLVKATHNCAFGTINPAVSAQKHENIYMNVAVTDQSGGGPYPPQGVARYNVATKTMDTWMPAPYEFCGEPIFAPKTSNTGADTNAGYLLTVLLDGQRRESDLIVLDAENLSQGPVTRIPLGMLIPHGLFGCFVPGNTAMWSSDSMKRRAKLANKMESRGDMWNEVKSDFSGLGLRLDDMDEYFPGLFG